MNETKTTQTWINDQIVETNKINDCTVKYRKLCTSHLSVQTNAWRLNQAFFLLYSGCVWENTSIRHKVHFPSIYYQRVSSWLEYRRPLNGIPL